jgi:hypothetical protein
MLGFNIGWQEILVILLFVLGFIVIPLPGRFMRRAKRKPVIWTEQFLAAPIESIHDVAEAFFCSYDAGEYVLVDKQRFRLTFHRGPQPGEQDEQIVLSLRGEGPIYEVPVTLRVLLQPRAGSLLVTLKHEVQPPGEMSAKRRKRLTRLFDDELEDFREYLRENFGEPQAKALEAPPRPKKRIDVRRPE